MSNLTKYLRMAVLSLLVFSSLAVASDSYAYWATSISGDATTQSGATVSMGEWLAPQWVSGTSYLVGDQVRNNGSIYEAKKNNPTKEPGVDGGWNSQWILIGPA